MTLSLVTGASGLIGGMLVEALQADRLPFVATGIGPAPEGIGAWVSCDVRDKDAVAAMLETVRPDVIYHLAAQSLPRLAVSDPWLTFDINVNGTINVFEAIRAIRTADPAYDPIVVLASSAMVYGASLAAADGPVTESAPMQPMHPYAVSKATQDMLAFQYNLNDGVRTIRARIFNCAGPGKRGDVVSDFARAVIRADAGGEPVRVGNLNARRAIMDVRDMVAALRALAARGRPGEAYNISVREAVTMGAVLDAFFDMSGRRHPFVVDPALLRGSDESVIVGDTSRIERDTGWSPHIPLAQTLRDVYAFERAASHEAG